MVMKQLEAKFSSMITSSVMPWPKAAVTVHLCFCLSRGEDGEGVGNRKTGQRVGAAQSLRAVWDSCNCPDVQESPLEKIRATLKLQSHRVSLVCNVGFLGGKVGSHWCK